MTATGLPIRITEIRKSYLGTEVLKGVSADVAPGQFTLLNGPSGSGKTTLLNLIAGLGLPNSGAVAVGETVVTDLKPAARTAFRAGVGLVFQRSGLLGGLTALENIQYGRLLTGQPIDLAWVQSLAKRLGIADVLQTSASKLSGGQAQRVALVRALAHRPRVLFADEPTASLDANSKHEIHELLRGLAHEDGTTILMVSHDDISPQYADAVLTLIDGQFTATKPVQPAVAESAARHRRRRDR